MKSVSTRINGLVFLLIALIISGPVFSQVQFPVCSGSGAGFIYYAANPAYTATSSPDIYKMDPVTGISTSVNAALPLPIFGGTGALAVCANINAGFPSLTYYTTFQVGFLKYLYYFNGSGWVNTTHIMPVTDICGAGPYIYGLDPTGYVYKYSGTANAAFLVDAGNHGSADIAGDCAGNFYVINQGGTPATLKKWNSNGVLLNTWTLTGTYGTWANGFAVNGNNIYWDGADGKLYTGVIPAVGTTVACSASSFTPFSSVPITDMGSCGFNGVGTTAYGHDTIRFCGGASNVTLTATGPGPYNWTVISGPGTITGTGNNVVVNAAKSTIITHLDADCNGVNTLVDTTVIYVATATVSAGPSRSIIGCRGQYYDSLCGSLTNYDTTILYAVSWTPLGATSGILSGQNQPCAVIIAPTKTTTYTMTVTTQSGCVWKDSVKITLIDSTPVANFTYKPTFGCSQDTVRFINLSSGSIDSVHWDFFDTTESTTTSPTHIYHQQGIYSVLLYVSNGFCIDSTRAVINTLHPNIADFGADDTTVCVGTLVHFKDKSKTYTCPGNLQPTFLYRFGDGQTSNLASPTHTYTKTGTYKVWLVIHNCLGCVDSVMHTVVVDSLPFISFIRPDTSICEGQPVHLIANYLTVGNTGTTIDMGDGTIFTNRDTVVYSFAKAQTYNVILTAHYRICPDQIFTQSVVVNPFPGVYIGPDTVLCPNGSPIVLSDRINYNNPNAKFLWSTHETTPSILAKDIGTYWAQVTLNGCSGTDSMTVNKDCYIDIPNSFTPNGDNNNDYFLPRQLLSRSLISFKMTIFNRYGEVIYQSSTVNGRGWDGKFNGVDQPQGVYVYLIDAGFDNGVKEHYTGNVTLLR